MVQACIFCTNFHKSENCKTFSSVAERQNRLNELRRCYRCLNTGHIAPDCKDFVKCGKCKSISHHVALCKKNAGINYDDLILNETCIFCWQHSNSSRCKVVTTHYERLHHAQFMYYCTLCLEIHPYMQCRIEMPPCMFCDWTTHNKALCPKNPFLDENYKHDPKENTCVFCGDHPKSEDCKAVTNLSLRIISLAAEGRCKRCLQLHETKRCPHSKKCKICRSPDHHRVICPLDPSLTSSDSPVPPSPSVDNVYSVDMESHFETAHAECSTLDANDYFENLVNQFKARRCASKSLTPSSPSSGYCSDEFSEPELVPASPSWTSSDSTWEHEHELVETSMNTSCAESKLHIWLGAKKRTPNQDRPTTPDYTIHELAFSMKDCGLPGAP